MTFLMHTYSFLDMTKSGKDRLNYGNEKKEKNEEMATHSSVLA